MRTIIVRLSLTGPGPRSLGIDFRIQRGKLALFNRDIRRTLAEARVSGSVHIRLTVGVPSSNLRKIWLALDLSERKYC